MTKKERLGSDPFKGTSLDWIQDTREEKKEVKKPKRQKVKDFKSKGVKASKRYSAKTPKHQNVKASEVKRKHTLYLSLNQSKKLRIYAAENDMQLSEVIEKLIDKNI